MFKKFLLLTIRWQVIFFMLVFIAFLIPGFVLLVDDNRLSMIINLYTEFLGVLFTVGVINAFLKMNEESSAELAYQQQLIREASSLSNETALGAIHTMRRKGWLNLEYSLLKNLHSENIHLKKANLKKAPLQECNLEWTNFEGAVLEEAKLSFSNLSNANLSGVKLMRCVAVGANIKHSHLYGTNFAESSLSYAEFVESDCEKANFSQASLDNADFSDANLKDTCFQDADLTNCNFENARFQNTILPDGSICNSSDDLAKFFDSIHIDSKSAYLETEETLKISQSET